MARRQGHDLEVLGVPGAQNDPPVVRVRLELVDHLRELVDALARVVRLGVDILGAKVPPLEPIDGAQVAHLAVRQPHAVEKLARAIAVPDLDALLAERERRGRARDEPEEFGENRLLEDALGGEERVDGDAVVVEAEL